MKNLLLAMLFTATLMASAQAEDRSGILKVGSTGIDCYMPPCPSRGISNSERRGDGFQRPIWWGEVLPARHASEEDRQRIIKAWDDLECLLIEGTFDGVTLAVTRIIAECP